MNNIENLSLGEIVKINPATASLFESVELDFCCNGKQTLKEALSNDHDILREVKSKLMDIFNSARTNEPDLTGFTCSQLIDYIIEKHHRYVRAALPSIMAHATKVAGKHSQTYPISKNIENLISEIKMDFEYHLMKEEVILFPMIKKMETDPNSSQYSSVESIIGSLENNHLDVGIILKEIRKITHGFSPPANSCLTIGILMDELRIFESDLHKHVHIENNILFPKAIELNTNNKTYGSCGL